VIVGVLGVIYGILLLGLLIVALSIERKYAHLLALLAGTLITVGGLFLETLLIFAIGIAGGATG
jgi:hypothetical protein